MVGPRDPGAAPDSKAARSAFDRADLTIMLFIMSKQRKHANSNGGRIMKKRILAFTVVALIAVMGGIAVAQGADTPKVSERLWILLDCSSNSRSYWEEIQAVGKAAIRALNSGDRVRIVAVMKRDSRVLLLEQVSNDENIRSEIIQTMTEIQPGSSSNTDLAKGLSVPLAALEKADANKSSVDLVLLLTSGKMEDETAQALLDVHDKLIAGGARVVVTGVRDSNPTLLLAAARGRLAWRDLDVFDPREWIAEVRKAAQPMPPPAVQPQKPDKQPPAAAPQSDTGSTSEHSKAVPSSPPTPSKTGPEVVPTPPTPEVPPSPPSSVTPAEPAKSAASPAPKAQGPAVLELLVPAGEIKVRVQPSATADAHNNNVESGVPSGPSLPARVPDEAPSLSAPRQLARTDGGDAHPHLPAIEESAPATSPATDQPAPGTAISPPPSPPGGPQLRWWYKWAAAGVAFAIIGILALRKIRTRPEIPFNPVGDKFKGRPSEMVARVNGSERSLGLAQSLVQFNVGSGPCNTLRIQEKGVEEQHLRIRKTSRDGWSAKNLSRRPLEINGATVDTGEKVALEFPAMVKLAETASFSLFLRPLAGHQETPVASSQPVVEGVSHG